MCPRERAESLPAMNSRAGNLATPQPTMTRPRRARPQRQTAVQVTDTDSRTGYTDQSIRHGIRYARLRLEDADTVPPIYQHCLAIYKSALESVLGGRYADAQERERLLWNASRYSRQIMPYRNLEDFDFIFNLSELRRYELTCRYHEYLVDVPENCRAIAKIEGVEHFESDTRRWSYWSELFEIIWEEHKLLSQRRGDVQYEEMRTTRGLVVACMSMGLHFQRSCRLIEYFVDYETFTDVKVLSYIKRGEWSELAETLSCDIRDLPLVTPHKLRHSIPVMQETIMAVIDTYFDRESDNPSDYRLWRPKAESLDLAAHLAVADPMENHSARIMAEIKRVSQAAAQRYNKVVDDCAALYFTEAFGEMDYRVRDLSGSEFRRSLSDGERTSKYVRQASAWGKLVDLLNTRVEFLGYRAPFGEVDDPLDPKFWFEWPEESE